MPFRCIQDAKVGLGKLRDIAVELDAFFLGALGNAIDAILGVAVHLLHVVRVRTLAHPGGIRHVGEFFNARVSGEAAAGGARQLQCAVNCLAALLGAVGRQEDMGKHGALHGEPTSKLLQRKEHLHRGKR